MIKKGKWVLDKDVDKMWNEIASWIKKVAKEIHNEPKGCEWLTKEIW